MIFAVVGAGGKTSLIKKLAQKYALEGKKVFITTSTHMFIEKETLLSDDPKEIIEYMDKNKIVMAGIKDHNKIKALSMDTYYKVCEQSDVVFIEADGSKHLPLKFLNDNEPVIYDNVDEIIIVYGMHALNQKAKDCIFRLELCHQYYNIDEYEIIDEKHLVNIVKKGYIDVMKEKYNDKKISLYGANAKTLYEKVISSLIDADYDISLVNKDWFTCAPTLIILGAGHVSMFLVKMASLLGFYIKVIDDRKDLLTKDRLEGADELICDSFDNIDIYLQDDAYYVVVTREHKDDFKCVKAILNRGLYRYLGMIGSKTKISKTYENLYNTGITKEQTDTIFAPIGLDIQARTPAEISISILAEIINEKNKISVSSISRELSEVNDDGVLCIIIEKSGSSPRGVGSMMFVGKDYIIDSIGGGAVEHQAIKDARTIDRVCIKDYSLNDRTKMELGMICGGTNKVLYIPIKKS